MDEDAFLKLIASAQQGSEHPIGKSLVEAARSRHFALQPLQGFAARSGRGVEATVDGRQLDQKKVMSEIMNSPAMVTGMIFIIICCCGSVVVIGVIFDTRYIERPMVIGKM